jgi:hypothetical protein
MSPKGRKAYSILMPALTFYAAFLATFLAITILTFLAWREHNPELPRSFSGIAAQTKRLVNWFRVVTVVVSTLFAITMYFFIIPKIPYGTALFVVWTIGYVSDQLLALFPERGTIERQLHSFFAYTLAATFLMISVIFVFSFSGGFRVLQIGTLVGMLILAALTRLDKKRFIFYELAFIYLSHFSILVAAIALK